MYQAEDLTVYPFFQEIMVHTELPYVLDSLTGVVSRPYILRYIQRLIAGGVAFELAIVDLDNFKGINDRCGHRTGDVILAQVAADLKAYAGSDGLVGRFGGDEFLVITFKGNDYDRVHDFCEGMYSGGVFRRQTEADGVSLLLTATTGCAAFPKDAADYDGLFALIDKTLYRGKAKGRNCYIIYLRAKHEHLQITSLARNSLYETFRQMSSGFDAGKGAIPKLLGAFTPMRIYMRMTRLIYVDGSGDAVDVETGEHLARLSGLEALTAGGLCALSNLDRLRTDHQPLLDFFTGLNMGSALILRVGEAGKGFGQLIFCPEPRTMRIWQDEECAAGFILARMLEQYLAKAD